jgi:hypothetical protein
MSYTPCRDRTFSLQLAPEYEYQFWYSLHWLKHLLERLGREPTLALYAGAFLDYDEELLVQILSSGWETVESDAEEDVEGQVSDHLRELFPQPVEGISDQEARDLLEDTPPFRQIHQYLPDLNVKRESTTYEALHLFRDGLALLAENLTGSYGKQGELLLYDAMLAELSGEPEPRMSAREYLSKRQARFTSEPDEPNMHSAGLEVEFIRGSESEVVTRVTECEWARYYRERHPSVGYMLACALDNAVYGWINDRIRLQRTVTLMEGGTECDFRVYAIQDHTARGGPEGDPSGSRD